MHFPTALEGLTVPPEGSRRMPRHWAFEALLLYMMQLEDKGGVVGLGHSTVTMVEGALNTGSCPEQPRCHNSWSVGAW